VEGWSPERGMRQMSFESMFDRRYGMIGISKSPIFNDNKNPSSSFDLFLFTTRVRERHIRG